MNSVYEIYDNYGNVVYVGETGRSISKRRHEHTSLTIKASKFKGHAVIVVAEFNTKKEALDLQEQLQVSYGIITDREKYRSNASNNINYEAASRGGKMAAITSKDVQVQNGKRSSNLPNHPNKLRVKCPHCPTEGGKMSMSRWHFDKCKHKIS